MEGINLLPVLQHLQLGLREREALCQANEMKKKSENNKINSSRTLAASELGSNEILGCGGCSGCLGSLVTGGLLALGGLVLLLAVSQAQSTTTSHHTARHARTCPRQQAVQTSCKTVSTQASARHSMHAGAGLLMHMHKSAHAHSSQSNSSTNASFAQ